MRANYLAKLWLGSSWERSWSSRNSSRFGADKSATNTTVDLVGESGSESKSKACRAWERRVSGDEGCVADPKELLDIQNRNERNTRG